MNWTTILIYLLLINNKTFRDKNDFPSLYKLYHA
jgi:hypothetical protein